MSGWREAGSGKREAIALYTPPLNARTGVAHYVSMLLPALREKVDVEVIDSPPSGARSSTSDSPSRAGGRRLPATRHPPPDSRLPLYQLGNNPHHAWIYEEAMRTPGVIVLHDLVLHHLIVEMTLARGDVEGYVAALRANHGEPGAAWARGRAAGLHDEIGNFLFPAPIEVANRSRAVIVHNRYAAERLRSFGVATPIHVVPHPYESYTGPRTSKKGVIGLFGFLTSAKRADVVVEAFRKTRGMRLLVVGEPAPNIDIDAWRAEGITFTGYVDDLDRYYGEVDRLVNLRYPSAGETSGTLIRAFAAGKPIAVSDYAQFAELPDDCVTKIPFGEGEVDALVRFFTSEPRDTSAAQQRWLEENASIAKTVEGYLASFRGAPPPSAVPITRSIALFAKVELLSMKGHQATIRNAGDIVLRARSYGEPAYRIIVKSGEWSRWLELPRDLGPGETAVIDVPAPEGVVTFHHALESIPMLDPEPWGRATIH